MMAQPDLHKTRYTRQGKILSPLPDDKKFRAGMESNNFKKRKHKGYAVLLYVTAIRCSEALRCEPEQFTIQSDRIVFEVGKRLKHGIQTPPLTIPLDFPFVDELLYAIKSTPPHTKIFPYSRKTGYNIIDRAFGFYPHFFRLNRISNFFLAGWTIIQIHSWTGLTLKALDFYIGLVGNQNMGMSLTKKRLNH
jgi:integrase